MKKYLYVCLVMIGVVILSSCKSQKVAVANFTDLDGEWNIVELNGKTLNPADTHQFIVFDMLRKSVSGNAGCNRMMGQLEFSDAQKNIIKFPQLVTTRMACPDMSGEQELLETLNKIVRFAPESTMAPFNKIALYGTDNSKLMVLEKK
jgi:heat shock protein HslJ